MKTGIECVDDVLDMNQYPTWLIVIMLVIAIAAGISKALP